ncbi:MAG: DUF4177 domain-containing protein [Clostridium perfringens]|nr:DUF4177 domain-containing protein [Clostridium perfringens]
MYEYKFIEVPLDKAFRAKIGSSFENCKEIIINESKNGLRLKQIITPVNEKTGIYMPYCYEIIFEKEVH